MRCMTDRRIKYLEELIGKYEKYCSLSGVLNWQTHLYSHYYAGSIEGVPEKF
jgi:hypothetical protein